MGVLLLCLVLLSFYQVGGRLLPSMPVSRMGIPSFTIWFYGQGYGAPILATSDEQHLNIDVISRFASVSNRFLIQSITNIFLAIICGILLWASILFIRDEIHSTPTTDLKYPALDLSIDNSLCFSDYFCALFYLQCNRFSHIPFIPEKGSIVILLSGLVAAHPGVIRHPAFCHYCRQCSLAASCNAV